MSIAASRMEVPANSGSGPVIDIPVRKLAALLIVSILPFAMVLGGEMVWDDRMLADGSAIGGGRSLLKCFTQPFLWHFFRPLVSVSFFFERLLWHGEPLGYHISNLLLHAAGTFVMTALLFEAFRTKRTAVIGGLLFALHPVQVGAVAWIGGRTDSLATLWSLLFLWMIVRSARSTPAGFDRWLALSVLFYNLAIYTKEQTLPLILLAPLAYRSWQPDRGVRMPRTWLFALLPFLLSATLFLTAGYYLGMPRPSPLPYSVSEIASLVGSTLSYYGVLLLFPNPSSMHRLSLEGFERNGIWPALIGYLVLGGLLFWLLRAFRRDPPIAWFLGITLLTLVPISNVLPLPFLVVAPYRAALPWIGLAAALGRAFGGAIEYLEAGGSNTIRASSVLRIVLAALLVWYGGLSAWGSFQWRSEQRIFSRILQYDPQSIVTKTVYTYTLERLGRFRDAAKIEEDALAQVFGSSAWRDWSSAEAAILHNPEVKFRARRNQGTNEDPRIWIAGLYAQLANCWMRDGDNERARTYLQIGDRIWSNHLRIHLGMGALALADGDTTEAVRRYRMALALDPENATAHSGLGYAYGYQRRWSEAAAEFERCLRIDPSDKDAKDKLAEVRAHLITPQKP